MDEFDKSSLVVVLLAVESSPVSFPIDILKHLFSPRMLVLHVFPENGSRSSINDFSFMPGGDGSFRAVNVKTSTLNKWSSWD